MNPPIHLFDVIAGLYDAGVGETSWSTSLERLAGLLGAQHVTAVYDNASGHRPVFHGVRHFVESDVAYMSHYWKCDPLRAALLTSGGALVDRMVIERRAFQKTEFFNDFARKFDMFSGAQGIAACDAELSAAITLTRGKTRGDFEQRDVDMLTALLPHLGRAMRLQLRLHTAQVMADSATGALDAVPHAVFLVTPSCKIAFANRGAEELLRAGDGLSCNGAAIQAATSRQTAILRQLIARAAGMAGRPATGGSVSLERPSGRRPLTVTVTPLPRGDQVAWVPTASPVAMMMVTDRDANAPSPDQLRDLYALTPSEAQLAVHIATGAGLKAAARAMGVAPSTARTHLHRVFGKTCTARQAELARLLAALPR